MVYAGPEAQLPAGVGGGAGLVPGEHPQAGGGGAGGDPVMRLCMCKPSPKATNAMCTGTRSFRSLLLASIFRSLILSVLPLGVVSTSIFLSIACLYECLCISPPSCPSARPQAGKGYPFLRSKLLPPAALIRSLRLLVTLLSTQTLYSSTLRSLPRLSKLLPQLKPTPLRPLPTRRRLTCCARGWAERSAARGCHPPPPPWPPCPC